MRISASEQGQAWLGQFDPTDVATAAKLLNALLFVSTNDLRHSLAEKIARQAAGGRLALYNGREFAPRARFFS